MRKLRLREFRSQSGAFQVLNSGSVSYITPFLILWAELIVNPFNKLLRDTTEIILSQQTLESSDATLAVRAAMDSRGWCGVGMPRSHM